MKLLVSTLMLAFSGLIAVTSSGFAAPVYMIAQIQVEDADRFFNEYGAAVGPILLENDAKILVATQEVKQLEGEWLGNWTVVIEFPSQASADGWYNSEKYQNDIIPVRLSSTKFGNMIILPAFVAPAN